MADFANILFSGRCNARCPFCIGRQVDPRLNEDNLRIFPPRNLDRLIELIGQQEIRQVILTGTDTDPQLYWHEEELLRLLREQTPPGTRLILHTNGRLALHKIGIFNQYDRVSISFPSFNPGTYRKMMGVPHPPELGEIMRRAATPVKISCVVTEMNMGEMGDFLAGCLDLGVRRLVLRKLYAEKLSWKALLPGDLKLFKAGEYRGNPVYHYQDMEITLWDFAGTESTSINLFSSGVISDQYLLPKTEVAGLLPKFGQLPA
jgi:MoaA/NifB/PqqE/SkfB family radical SAM enzyme